MKQRNIWALPVALGAGALAAVGLALGSGSGKSEYVASAVANPLYKEECGSCHLAYSPALLPAPSWGRIMDGLDDHFGEDAELDAATATQIRTYLGDNAADSKRGKRAVKIAHAATNEDAPLRITETAYFLRKHDEVPQRLVFDNPEVGGFSQCESCHRGADAGRFDDDDVNIPGYGRWDD